jgi:hypothetical protein
MHTVSPGIAKKNYFMIKTIIFKQALWTQSVARFTLESMLSPLETTDKI